IHRVTMFRVPLPANIQPILDQYAKLQQEAKKDGKPYILRCVANRTFDDPRNQGYTICAHTSFASVDDMKYYDEQCEAHAALKAVAKDKIDPPPLMMF
ncbi:stress responsive A/B barrel domain-containing protein, partial [Delphinella strobiligena]